MTNDNNQAKPTPLDITTIENLIQNVFKAFGALAGAAALFYATGFLVVNIRLLSLGAYEGAILRERYVAAGTAFILTLTIVALTTIFVAVWIESGLEKSSHAAYFQHTIIWKLKRKTIATFFLTMLVMFFVSLFLSLVSSGLRPHILP